MIPTFHFRWNLVPKTEPHMYDATLQQWWYDKLGTDIEPDGRDGQWIDIPKHYAI